MRRGRGEGADLALDLLSGPGPVDPRLGLVDLRRVGCAVVGLRLRLRLRGRTSTIRARPFAPSSAISSVTCPAFLRSSVSFPLQQHRPGVEPVIHLHDGHAGHRVAGQDRPLDRRSAAPARQQRSMNVHAAHLRRVEDRLGQDQAVGRDHRDIGVQGGEARLFFGVSERSRACGLRVPAARRARVRPSSDPPCRARPAAAAGSRPQRPRALPRPAHSSVGTAKSGLSHEDDPHCRALWRTLARIFAYLIAAMASEEIEALAGAWHGCRGSVPARRGARCCT